MGAQASAVGTTAPFEARAADPSRSGAVLTETISVLTLRVRAEYREMPGLRLTVGQAARLFAVAPLVAHVVLEDLRRGSVLKCSDQGTYSLNR